jgi:stage V sporulation protein G
MKITEIQIIPIKANNGLVAFGSVLFDGCLFLGSIGIHKRLDGAGYRITYPTKKINDKNINIYHPINKKASKLIEEAIIAKIEKLLNQ